ncbi:MAG: radical SAM protein [Xanthobacteraceae bacterium]
MSRYRVAANIEWTSKCNARCIMCPRDAIPYPRHMSRTTFERILGCIQPSDVFRVVVAGYGEPTTHPEFEVFVDLVRGHPVPFDLVSNGQLLDQTRLQRLDGVFGALMISFSSVDPDVYRRVHANLDQQRVMANIQLARNVLRKTQLAISLSPLPDCLRTLDRTVGWLRSRGIDALTMSPTLYDRAGKLNTVSLASADLKAAIRRHGLHRQDLDFIPSVSEIFAQWRANRFHCIPRNTDVLISAQGDYMYCFNDINHGHALGNVADTTLREALEMREDTDPDGAICNGCNLRGRYGPAEVTGAALGYAKLRLGRTLRRASPH